MGKEDITKNDLMNDDFRRQYLLHYILERYKFEIKNSGKVILNQLYFSYLAFAIDALENQSMSFREILKCRLQRYSKASLRNKQRIIYFLNLANQKFSISVKSKNHNNKPKLYNIIQFDDLLEQSSLQYKYCLKEKQQMLQTICKDYINLKQLDIQTRQLHKYRKLLAQNLLILFHSNSTSAPLQIMCDGFDECLSIENTFTRLYHQQQSNPINGLQNKVHFYSDDSTAIYISLLKDIGKIVKVSKNFQDVVPFVENNKQAIGKNINFFQPDQIAEVHDKILLNCLEKKTLSEDIRDYPIILAKDLNGWSIPYHLKIQMCMIGTDELGACGWLKQIIDENLYLMTSSVKNKLKIFLLDSYFYDMVFSGNISQSETKKISLGSIIPMLRLIVEKGQPGQYYETIAIKPQNLQEAQIDRDDFDQGLISKFVKMNLFQIKFAFFPVNNQFVQFVEYQIVSMKPLTNLMQKKEAINNFKMQMIDLVDLNKLKMNYDGVIKSMNQSVTDVNNSDFNQVKNKNENSLDDESLLILEQQLQLESNRDIIQLDLSSVNSKLPSQRQIQEATPNKRLSIDQKIGQYSSQQNNKELNKNKIMEDRVKQISIPKVNTYNSLQSNLSLQQQLADQNDHLINPLTTAETHRTIHLLSQDSIPFSPISNTQRKPLLESAKQSQHFNFISSPILENSLEDENLSNKIQAKKRMRNVSVSDRIEEIFYPQKENQNPLSSDDPRSNDKKSSQQIEVDVPVFQEEREKEGSIKTSITSKSSTKAQIIRTIKSKTQSKGLRFINIFGIFCIGVIMLVNLLAFLSQVNEQDRQQKNFEQIFWCFQMKRFSMLILGNRALVKSINNGYYDLPTDYDKGYAKKLFAYTNNYLYTGYKNLTQELLHGDSKVIDIFAKVSDYSTEHYIPNIYDESKISVMKTSLTYKLLYFQNYAYYLMYSQDPQYYNEVGGRINAKSINTELKNVYDSNSDIFYSYLDKTQFLITLQLFGICIITGIFSLLVIPIYASSQSKREDILKLFASFSPEQIRSMMSLFNKFVEKYDHQEQLNNRNKQLIRNSFNNIPSQQTKRYIYTSQHKLKSQNNHTLHISNHSMYQLPIDNMKKKTISHTSNIPRMSKRVVIGLIICLVLNQFYPITNYIIQHQEIDNFKQNLDFLNSLNFFYDNLTNYIQMRFILTYAILTKETPPSLLQGYLNYFKSLRDETQPHLESLIKQFSEFENFNGYGKEEYQNYLNPIFKNNVCDTIFDPKQNHMRDVTLNQEKCNKLGGGMYQKGLIVAFKKFISIFDLFYEGAIEGNATKFQKVLDSLQKDMKVVEEYEFYQYGLLLSKVIHYFFQDVYQMQHDHNFKLSVIIISLQFFIIILVMIFGWWRFFKYIGKQYYKSKQLLDLIDIKALLENPYILSYFKRNS